MSKTTPPRNDKKIKKGDDLILPCGGVILAEPNKHGERVISAQRKEIEKEIDAALEDPFSDVHAAHYHRSLADLPTAEPAAIKTTFIVLSMSLWGLNEHAISRYLNVDIEQIRYIIESEMYEQFRVEMLEAIRFSEESVIHGYLASKARDAAVVIASQIDGADKNRALKAAQDILDRTGFRPVDRTEHVHTFDDDLRIVQVAEKPVKEIDL